MKIIKIILWLFILTLLMFIPMTLRINLPLTIEGIVGTAELNYIVLSICYLIGWFLLSIWSGFKNYKEILIAAMIYSSYPILGVIAANFLIKTPLVILTLIFFIWSAPIQGICFESEKILYLMIIIQPIIFLVGYYLSGLKRKS